MLFGSILGVSLTDIVVIGLVTIMTAAVIFFRYRALLFTTFDPEVADVTGVNTARVDALLMLVLAASILVTMKVIGVLLIAAMLVIPPVVARMLTNSFSRMLGISTAIGAACGFIGMYASYHLAISSGASIVLVGSIAFAGVYTFTGSQGRRRASGMHDHAPISTTPTDYASSPL